MKELDIGTIRNSDPKLYIEMVRSNGDIFIQTNIRKKALCMLYMELADVDGGKNLMNDINNRSDAYGVADIKKFEVYDVASVIIGIINSDEVQVDSKCDDVINICNRLDDDIAIEVPNIYKIFSQIKYVPDKLSRCYKNIASNKDELLILSNSMKHYQNIINDSTDYETINATTIKSRLQSLNLRDTMMKILNDVKQYESISSDTSDVESLSLWKDAYCVYIYLVNLAIHRIVESYMNALDELLHMKGDSNG